MLGFRPLETKLSQFVHCRQGKMGKLTVLAVVFLLSQAFVLPALGRELVERSEHDHDGEDGIPSVVDEHRRGVLEVSITAP